MNAVTRATIATRLVASILPRNSLVSVLGRLIASTMPTAGGPAGAGCACVNAVASIVRAAAVSRPIGILARSICTLPRRHQTLHPTHFEQERQADWTSINCHCLRQAPAIWLR